MDDTFREYIEVKEELDDISMDRKERSTVLKGLEDDIQKFLEKETDNNVKVVDQYKIYLTEVKTKKAINAKNLVLILTNYFNGDSTKAENLAEYIWHHRPVDIKKQIKISKPRKTKKN